MNKFQSFYHNFNHENPAEEQFEEARQSGIIKSYFLTTMGALNARRVTDFCLWCDEIWSVDHHCDCAPDYNCRFTFGKEFEGIAFVRIPRYVLKTLDVNDLMDESRHSSAHNMIEEVSTPDTSCLKEDTEISGAHQVFDACHDHYKLNNIESTMSISWDTPSEMKDDTNISDAHKVLDEIPLPVPEFIKEMADAANITPDWNSIECGYKSPSDIIHKALEAILKESEFKDVDGAECQFTTTATVVDNGTQGAPFQPPKSAKGFFESTKDTWNRFLAGLSDSITGGTNACGLDIEVINLLLNLVNKGYEVKYNFQPYYFVDFVDCITDLLEYDVPYHVRFCIDNDVRCGQWYDVSILNTGVVLDWRLDLLQRAEVHVCAFDIETTNLHLRFPDAEYDSIMIISYMVDRQRYLIINSEFVGRDIEDLEYTPKPEFEGCFRVAIVKNKKELLRNWFSDHMQEVKPGIYVTYNGDFFEWQFLERKAAEHGYKMGEEISFQCDKVIPFIFSLATIIPLPSDEVLRKGSETLCQMFLMVQTFNTNAICPNQHQSKAEKLYTRKLPVIMTFSSFIFDPGGGWPIPLCTSASKVSKVLLLASVIKKLKENLRVAIEYFKRKVMVFIFDPGILWGRLIINFSDDHSIRCVRPTLLQVRCPKCGNFLSPLRTRVI